MMPCSSHHTSTQNPSPRTPKPQAAIAAWLRLPFFFSDTTPLCLPTAWCILMLYCVCDARTHYKRVRVSTMSSPVTAFGLRIPQQKAKEACSNRPNRQPSRANHASSLATTIYAQEDEVWTQARGCLCTSLMLFSPSPLSLDLSSRFPSPLFHADHRSP